MSTFFQKKNNSSALNGSVNHVAVITVFKSGAVYYFKAISADQAGNIATSTEYAHLTPRKKENIIQVIISNFEDIFGWVNR